MSNYNDHDTIPVPRSRIFVLDDGSFVVQWEENRVQELLSGRYQNYSVERFGNSITDYELNQLQKSNVVSHYDTELVYLSPLPSIAAQQPNRSFYLNTTLHKSHKQEVEQALVDAGLSERFAVRILDIFVIIRGQSGFAFDTFDDAERAREVLAEKLPDMFHNTAVAFVELNAAS